MATTNNVADFVATAAAWQSTGRSHCAIVFTSDASMPRSKHTIGRYVTALDTLMTVEPDAEPLLISVGPDIRSCGPPRSSVWHRGSRPTRA